MPCACLIDISVLAHKLQETCPTTFPSLWLPGCLSRLSAPSVGTTTLPDTLMQTLEQTLYCLLLIILVYHLSIFLYHFIHGFFSSSSVPHALLAYKVYYLMSSLSLKRKNVGFSKTQSSTVKNYFSRELFVNK